MSLLIVKMIFQSSSCTCVTHSICGSSLLIQVLDCHHYDLNLSFPSNSAQNQFGMLIGSYKNKMEKKLRCWMSPKCEPVLSNFDKFWWSPHVEKRYIKIWQNRTPTWAAPPFPSPALSSSWRLKSATDVHGPTNGLYTDQKNLADRPDDWNLGLGGGRLLKSAVLHPVWCFPLNPRGKYSQSVGSRSAPDVFFQILQSPGTVTSGNQHHDCCPIKDWLVVGIYPSEKSESVGMMKFAMESHKNPYINHVFPYINHIFMINQYWTWFQTTNQQGLVHAFTKPSKRAAGSMKRNATP